MKIKSILIKNYKSIKDVFLPFESYGDDKAKSRTTFLVGINESGKTAILEAINLLATGFYNTDYNDICYLPSQESDDYIDLYAHLEMENLDYFRKHLIEKFGFPLALTKQLQIGKIEKNVYYNSRSANFQYNIEVENISLHEYLVSTSTQSINGKIVSKEEIKVIREVNNIDEEINETNAEKFLKDDQKLLTKDKLEELIAFCLKETLDQLLPKIQLWRPSPEYLINTTVSLEKFKEDTNISIPLKNMFHIYGKTTDKEIKATIERALKNQARRDELVERMSETVTKHINKIWKEHKIKIRVSINGGLCDVFVEDKDQKHTYYRMEQRSAGFQQFVSLILSLSALNDCSKLMNAVILIDEPEVHLHPSGIKYMRNEILKIGKNNSVFVATHSNYMVDTSCPERHWIVVKEKSQTRITQIGEDTPIEDDAVLASAFGLNLFKELLPRNIIVVEGADDKSVISHAFRLLKAKFFYSIKTAKGASKAYSIAALLSEEKIPAYFLFDDDKEGRDYKNKILDNYKESFSQKNVFTLRDIHPLLPKDATLEDLMPVRFVQEFFEVELSTSFTLNEGNAYISQLKQQSVILRSDKQKLDGLKLRLSKKFCEVYSNKHKLEVECPQLVSTVDEFVKKLEIEI